ncbi:glycoside hydrolase family 32 protein [Cohnella nanjingensis]|uniref:Sucrose-6-phosphate hydrolase n=2 Tax=Cohnella nanjingensis TaxID=1387779 RepID=A0A7X0VJ47_9BACL|nr:glycoside hydrolase family 32 protein [Cohnella nanjingensis]
MGEFGWMNDPNGFVPYRGNYHLFYQHYPYLPTWGPMHWGHAVSRDLIKWTYLPIALAPGESYDSGGCFSGSAIEKDGALYLMYTGHVVTGPDSSKDYWQTQNLAVSEDGVFFRKYEGNPVIGLPQIPAGASLKDFRDPKVFERDGSYYVVIGSNDGQGNGQILLYRSADLTDWTFIGIMAKSGGEMGNNWECPDFFSIGETDFLMFSPQRMPPQGRDYGNLHSTLYMRGRWDERSGEFHSVGYAPMDQGFDFYAPQSTLDERGRRIVIGWMDMWESEMPTQQGHQWAGAMTLPREMIVLGGQVRFRPVAEIENYRGERFELRDLALEGETIVETAGDSYELEAVFDAGDAARFGLKLRVGGGEETVLSYSQPEGVFALDRNRSGIGPGGVRETAIPLRDGKLMLRVFVDRSSLEVFLQDGEKVMTARIYPGSGSLGIAAFSDGKSRLASLRKWDIH